MYKSRRKKRKQKGGSFLPFKRQMKLIQKKYKNKKRKQKGGFFGWKEIWS